VSVKSIRHASNKAAGYPFFPVQVPKNIFVILQLCKDHIFDGYLS